MKRTRETRCRTWIKLDNRTGFHTREMDKWGGGELRRKRKKGATSSMTTKQRPRVGGREKW